MLLAVLATLMLKIGMSLAIGSSTYAVTFYLKSIADGVMSDTERDFLHTVYFILRIGMGLIIAGELILLGLAWYAGGIATLLTLPVFWFKWGLIATIGVNALLMHKHLMPMGFGPAIAGGSWYMYLVADTLKASLIPLWGWIALYGIFVIGFTVLLRGLRSLTKLSTPVPPAA
jgi:hypothetical protein